MHIVGVVEIVAGLLVFSRLTSLIDVAAAYSCRPENTGTVFRHRGP